MHTTWILRDGGKREFVRVVARCKKFPEMLRLGLAPLKRPPHQVSTKQKPHLYGNFYDARLFIRVTMGGMSLL